MRFFLYCFCLLGFSALHAQADVDAATPTLAYRTAGKTEALTNYQLQRRDRTLLGDLDLSGVWGGPTYNYSMTGDDWALMRGGYGGLEFGDEFFLGYGGWKAREDFMVDEPTAGSPQYRFKNSGFILAYTPLSESPIHPRVTTIIGPGKVNLDPATIPDGADTEDRMLIGQAMVGLELNLFQWFRLGIDGGYRFANGVDLEFAGTDILTDQDVSGAIFQIEARFGFSW